MAKQSLQTYLFFIISLVGYCLFSFQLQRPDTASLLSTFVILFAVYWYASKPGEENQIKFWVAAAILFRLCFLFSIPTLSDDFYRFIWDGRLLTSGFHPFANVPRYYIENTILISEFDLQLFTKLNSPDYFTIYPPLNQFIFFLAAKIAGNSILGSVVVMRISILASEIGSLIIIDKLLGHYQLPKKNILLYALNPLVIIELTGNLHFEAMMIFFLLLSFWLLVKNKIAWSALSFSLAISSKLLPVLILPLLLVRLGWKKFSIYGILVAIFCAIEFLPLLSHDILVGFRQSIGYYFSKFEFNASIYYLVREWGFWKYGYNIIQTVGWKVGVWCAAFVLVITLLDGYLQKFKVQISKFKVAPLPIDSRPLIIDYRLLISCLFIFTVYFAFATTVHPWYVTTILAFSIFTRFRYPMLWTGLIFLTYVGYDKTGFTENLWITAGEYILMFGYLAYELIWKKEKQLA